VGSYIAIQRRAGSKEKDVDALVFWLAALFSSLFLLVVNGTVFYLPFISTPLSALHGTNLLLGSLQGVVGTCLGVFFAGGHAVGGERQRRASRVVPIG